MMTVASVLMMLAAGPGAALAGVSGAGISANAARGTSNLSASAENGQAGPLAQRQIAVDDHWHGHGYGPYPSGPYYYRPYRPPVVIAPAPVVVVPAPVIVSPAPVYAYPAPVVVP